MTRDQAICTVCDHEIVPGVACDGMPEECPSHAPQAKNLRQPSNFAATVEKVTGERDFVCVKGID